MSFWNSAFPLGLGYEVALRVILAVGCATFIVRYWKKHRWWKNDVGRHLMSMSVSLGLLGLFSLLVLVWPEIPIRGFIRMVLLTLLALAVAWRVVVFERYHLAKGRERRAEEE